LSGREDYKGGALYLEEVERKGMIGESSKGLRREDEK
jgi:hypothetical protein